MNKRVVDRPNEWGFAPPHFFKTSNVWTAQALQLAGVPIHPRLSITAGERSAQVRPYGPIRSAPKPK